MPDHMEVVVKRAIDIILTRPHRACGSFRGSPCYNLHSCIQCRNNPFGYAVAYNHSIEGAPRFSSVAG
jgi:hypothetical protein